MNKEPILVPIPQKLKLQKRKLKLSSQGIIVLNLPNPLKLLPATKYFQKKLNQIINGNWQIAAGPDLGAKIIVHLDPSLKNNQSYTLTINSKGIVIVAKDEVAAFYGLITLEQLLSNYGATLPYLKIEDWPDFPVRGVMLDISRDKVPTMVSLYALIDKLALLKINQFQLYTEHTFAYRGHKEVWEKASAITAEQILLLDQYCKERFIDLVPNQNSFGHMQRWLKFARYRSLAETDGNVQMPWGEVVKDPFTLSPAEPGSLELLKELYSQLLPNFSSSLFNVGCDEVFDLNIGKCKEQVAKHGRGMVYLDFLLQIHKVVKSYGHTMQFWGDVVRRSHTTLPKLPKDIIVLDWGYEAERKFSHSTGLLAEAEVPFYVCPGTSSWSTIAGRTENTIGNLNNAVENGLKNGACGLLLTDWGDWGHWQFPYVSYLGYTYSAALSWSYKQNLVLAQEERLTAALDHFFFCDKAHIMGKIAYNLGNAYLKPGFRRGNSSMLFWFYHFTLEEIRNDWMKRMRCGKKILQDNKLLWEKMRITIDYIKETIEPLGNAQMQCSDASLIKEECALSAKMLVHSSKRLLLQLGDFDTKKASLLRELQEIEEVYKKLWLARNRYGGLEDSVSLMHKAQQLYL